MQSPNPEPWKELRPPAVVAPVDLEVSLHGPHQDLSGVSLHADRVLRELQPLVRVTLRRQWSKEVTLFGRKFGGNLTRVASRALMRGRGEVVHAIDPFSAPQRGRLDVVTVHDVMPMQYPDLYGDAEAALNRTVLKNALARDPLVTTPSYASRAAFLGHMAYDPAKVFVSPHGVDPHILAGAPGIRPPYFGGAPYVLLNMDDNPRKRADLALEALAPLGVNVVHVGKPRPSFPQHKARIEAAAKPLADAGRYVRLEYVAAPDLGALYAHAALLVHLTHDEGIGLPPLEAMACGARVLASDVPVLREILEPHASFCRLDAASVRAEAERLLAAPAAPRPDAMRHARAFSWERHARELVSVYLRARFPDEPKRWAP